jgi:hypothetical protein
MPATSVAIEQLLQLLLEDLLMGILVIGHSSHFQCSQFSYEQRSVAKLPRAVDVSSTVLLIS